MSDISKNNHYVPRFYLQNWSDDGSHVWMYRKIVSSKSVEWWKRQSISSTSSIEHLYNTQQEKSTSDEFEKWLNTEIETPAADVLDMVVNNKQLKLSDLEKLVRFFSAQMVRTPTYFMKFHNIISPQLRDGLDEIKTNIIRNQISLSKQRELPKGRDLPELDFEIPYKITPIEEEDGNIGIKLEAACGRQTWLNCIRAMDKTNMVVLMKHRWHIIKAHPDIQFPTSDDPVITLAFGTPRHYHFNAGLNQKNAELIMPLTPNKLLYAKVGEIEISTNLQENLLFSTALKKLILQHGFTAIYAKNRLKNMFRDCPRIESVQEFEKIREFMNVWHTANSELERHYLDEHDALS